ncbi:MAG TPA: hypothetical protein VIS06_11130, partial [Mycobacteriales bacterium]
MAFEVAEQAARAGHADADAVDLAERAVERVLDQRGVGAVGLGGFVVEGEQHVEVGNPGDGVAAGNA